MIEFLDFEFEGDRFYEKKTLVPFTQNGLTLLRGKNFDASVDGKASNGTGKTRLVELLVAFVTGKSPRGNFKKVVLPSFTGTLRFKTKTDKWGFTYTPSKSVDAWSVLKNDMPIKVSHKPSDVQELLQKTIGLSKDDFNFFVFINQRSLDVLIKGKPSEKKLYLEGFFNIDSFYSNQFEYYKEEFSKSKGKLENLKTDRIRLDSVNEAKRELPGEKWVELQIENCDTTLSLIKSQIKETTDHQSALGKQIETWNQYLKLFTQLQGMDIKWLQSEQETLLKSKGELERKAKLKLQLEVFLKTKITPHQGRKPIVTLEIPTSEKPDHKEIAEKGIALSQMQEKLRLKKQITPLAKELDDLSEQLQEMPSSADIDKRKAEYYKEKVDAEDHYKLLQKGGDACPTCKQPLSFILEGLTAAERKKVIETRIKEITEGEKECLRLAAFHAKASRLSQQVATLQEQFARYPTFGVKLSVAEGELQQLKDALAQWEAYEKEQDALIKWQTTYDLLVVEANNLGFPDALKEDHSEELKQIADRLPILVEEIKQFDRFDELTETVITLPQLQSIEEQEKEQREDLATLMGRVEALNEFKGSLRTQLTSLVSLKAQAQALEAKVAGTEEAESECKILELMNDFYSPSGFKVYELKKRCQKLIDRSNHWSKMFFQEPYQWSLSEDLDDLDFFIQPTNDPTTEPYPIACLSAGEYNRAARVLLFSQLELIPPNKKTNLLFLDEIEGHLDEMGMVAFTEVVLPKLKETFPDRTIVVISHQSSIQTSECLDHLWLAERKDRKTKLTVFQDYHRRKA